MYRLHLSLFFAFQDYTNVDVLIFQLLIRHFSYLELKYHAIRTLFYGNWVWVEFAIKLIFRDGFSVPKPTLLTFHL